MEIKKKTPRRARNWRSHYSYLRGRRSLPARETVHGMRFSTEVASRGEELSMP
jgi:hypothetical protein